MKRYSSSEVAQDHMVERRATSPERFKDAGPTWPDYFTTLCKLDQVWRTRRHRGTSFGVFGNRPSWEDTIDRANVLFQVQTWETLTDEQASLIAPTHWFEDGNALLGSVGRRSNAVRSFLYAADAASDRDEILRLLIDLRSWELIAIQRAGGDILARMCVIDGLGRAFATRLLALARPDAFIVVNNKSLIWLRKATDMSLTGKARSYRDLLAWLSTQRWYCSPEPTDQLQRRLWHMRAALIDAYAYEPAIMK